MFVGSISITSHFVTFRTELDDVLIDSQSADGDANGARVQRTDVDRTEVGERRGDEGRLENVALEEGTVSNRRILFIYT